MFTNIYKYIYIYIYIYIQRKRMVIIRWLKRSFHKIYCQNMRRVRFNKPGILSEKDEKNRA